MSAYIDHLPERTPPAVSDFSKRETNLLASSAVKGGTRIGPPELEGGLVVPDSGVVSTVTPSNRGRGPARATAESVIYRVATSKTTLTLQRQLLGRRATSLCVSNQSKHDPKARGCQKPPVLFIRKLPDLKAMSKRLVSLTSRFIVIPKLYTPLQGPQMEALSFQRRVQRSRQ